LKRFFRATRWLVAPAALLALAIQICPLTHATPQSADPQAAYEQALALLQNGKNADALAVLDAAIAAGTHDASLYNLKGLAAGGLGRYQEAEQSFREVIRLTPKSAMGYNNLGILLSQLGHYEDAADTFRKAQACEPKNFTALLGLGTSLAALHNYAEAADYLQKAWGVRPGDFQTGYEWAHALLEAKQPAAARKVLNQLAAPDDAESAAKYYSLAGVIAENLEDYTGASQSYRQAYKLSPNSYDIYLPLVRTMLATSNASLQELPAPPQDLSAPQNLALGLLFVSHGADEEAIPRLEGALQQDPTSETALLNLALAYKGAGKTAQGINLLRRTLTERPTAAVNNVLGSLEEDSGQYVEAVQHYQRAVELDPGNEQYYFDLGMEYLSHFTFGPALEVYKVGTGKFPTVSRQFLGLAFSHYALREYEEAADAFTTAIEIDPDSPAALAAWNTVLDFLVPKDWEALLPRLSHLASAHPQSAQLAFCYGAALYRSQLAKGSEGTLEHAQAILEKSVSLQPNFPKARLELGGLYAARGDNQKAVAQYLEVIREDPKSDIAHYRLGLLYREMNKLNLATQELSQYQGLARLHQEELKRNRSAVKQFVVSQSARPSN
jgi:tetratricopeptide (TPR) repeat protein